MSKKKLFALILSVVVALSVPVAVFAHPGRTDEYGGHYDWETGEYHYHHGYPAHQHIDGYCPYDYDDQTDHSNHGGGYSYDYDYDYDYDYEEPADNYNYEEEIKDKPVRYTVIGHILNVVYSLICGILMGALCYIEIFVVRGAIIEAVNAFGYQSKFLICCDFIIICISFFISCMQKFYNFDIYAIILPKTYKNYWYLFQVIIVLDAFIRRLRAENKSSKK